MANLTEDSIIEILLRLPVSYIARFRCVCKSWNNLLAHDIRFVSMKVNHDIRKRNFKLLHTTRRKQITQYPDEKYYVESQSLVSNEGIKTIRYPFENLSKNKDNEIIQILGNCNGLICVCTHWRIVYLWNPFTKEYKVIQSPKKPVGYQSNRQFIFKINCGFGYDSKTCDYKYVSIFRERNMEASGVEIYSLSSDSWKTYGSCIPHIIPRGETGVFLNGALHWLTEASTGTESRKRKKSPTSNQESQVILSFNLEEEIFREIPLAEGSMDTKFDYKFVDVLRGNLCLLCSVSKVGFEIWEMKDYGVRESWSKMFKTDNQLIISIPSYNYLRSAVPLENGEILLHVRVNGIMPAISDEWQKRSCVVRISLEENEKIYHNRIHYMKMEYIVQMVAYTESLVSVNSGTCVGDVQEEEKDYCEAIKGFRSRTFLDLLL